MKVLTDESVTVDVCVYVYMYACIHTPEDEDEDVTDVEGEAVDGDLAVLGVVLLDCTVHTFCFRMVSLKSKFSHIYIYIYTCDAYADAYILDCTVHRRCVRSGVLNFEIFSYKLTCDTCADTYTHLAWGS